MTLLYSPQRSGGTLVYNIVSHFIQDIKPQTHELWNRAVPWPGNVISSYRDFRDSILSSWRTRVEFDTVEDLQQCTFDDPLLKADIKLWEDHVIPILNKYRDHFGDNILLLQYEKFVNDFDYIFDRLEPFLGIDIPNSTRNEIKETCSIDAMRKVQRRFSTNEKYDYKTQIHGYHIFTGKPGTWKDLLVERDHDKLTKRFASQLKDWGYE